MKISKIRFLGAPLFGSFLLAACNAPVGALHVADSVDDAGTTTDTGSTVGVVPVNFGRDIRPLMNRADSEPFGCKRCHYRNGDDPQGIELGGLEMTTLGDLRKGGVSSKRSIVVPGNPEASAIIQKLEGKYPRGARMPKDRTPWSAEELGLVRRWIAEGAVGADNE